MKTKKRWTTPPIHKREVEKKLDKIIELLEEIKQNTTPVVTIPTIWTGDQQGGDSINWDGNNNGWWSISDGQEAWVDPNKQPEACSAVATTSGQYSPNPNCSCSRCNSSDGTGGCVKCKCRNVAIYREDGTWWCNRCHNETFRRDGSLK